MAIKNFLTMADELVEELIREGMIYPHGAQVIIHVFQGRVAGVDSWNKLRRETIEALLDAEQQQSRMDSVAVK